MDDLRTKIVVELSVARRILADCLLFEQDRHSSELSQIDKDNNNRIMKVNSMLYKIESLIDDAFRDYRKVSNLAKEYKDRVDYNQKVIFHLKGLMEALNVSSNK